jgi:glyoxylase-like metal-dependent hydrolase (beta-lactamase superfamily II)
MTSVALSEENVIPLPYVAENVLGLRILFVNVFAVTHGPRSWTLIDTGLPFSAGYIRKWAEEHFAAPPESILLTHGHFDHASGAQELSDAWQVPVYAHLREFPYLTGKKSYPAPRTGAGGGLMSWLAPLYPRGPIDLGNRLRAFPESEDGSEVGLPGWQILFTPGHTPGHVSFFRPADRLLLAGDAFCTTKPESFFEAALFQEPELHGPPAYFTWNPEIAVGSIHSLADLQPDILAPGHGHPIAGEAVAAKMAIFAEQLAVSSEPAA